jgi:hypothetical protein
LTNDGPDRAVLLRFAVVFFRVTGDMVLAGL